MSQPMSQPRRHPATGGYARGEETRARIIDAALKVFAEHGYAWAATRQIAAEADITPPALQYYFGSKDGLHRACGEFLVERISEVLREPLSAAEQALGSGARDVAAEALCELLDKLLLLSIASQSSPAWRHFLARAQADGVGPAFPIVRDNVLSPLFKLCIALTAKALGKPRNDQEARMVAVLLMTQATAFGAARGSNLAALGWKGIEDSRLKALRDALRRVVRGALGASRAR